MRRWLGGLLWLGAGLCSTGVTPIACIAHSCTAIGCNDSEQLSFRVPVGQVSDTNVSACRNARCWHGSVAAADLTASMTSRWLRLAADDSSSASVECSVDIPSPADLARF